MDGWEKIERLFKTAWIMLGGAFLMRLFEDHWPSPLGWAYLFLTGALIVAAESIYRRIVGLLEHQNSLLQQIASAIGREE